MLTCIAPRCSAPHYARGYCRGHYARAVRAGRRKIAPDLSPLRDPDTEARNEVVSIRVTPATKRKASADPEGVRRAVERWARR